MEIGQYPIDGGQLPQDIIHLDVWKVEIVDVQYANDGGQLPQDFIHLNKEGHCDFNCQCRHGGSERVLLNQYFMP